MRVAAILAGFLALCLLTALHAEASEAPGTRPPVSQN